MALTGDEMPIEPMLKPIKRRRVRLLPACGIGAASSRRLIGGGGEGVGEGDEGNGGGEGDGGGGEGLSGGEGGGRNGGGGGAGGSEHTSHALHLQRPQFSGLFGHHLTRRRGQVRPRCTRGGRSGAAAHG